MSATADSLRVGHCVVPAPLIVALLIALTYAGLILAHAVVIRRRRRPGAYEPRAALWLAARLGRRSTPPDPAPPALTEGEAIDGLLRGELDPAAYRAVMADVAARAATRTG
jgi:hypothetical protein